MVRATSGYMPLKPSKKVSFNIKIHKHKYEHEHEHDIKLKLNMHGNIASDLSWNKCWNAASDNFMMAVQCPVATSRKELLQDEKVQVPRKSWRKVSSLMP